MGARRSRAGGDFDPSDAAGYEFDYDAENYSAGTLLDISGNGRHLTQATESARPTLVSRNGRDALSFDGGDRLDGAMGTALTQPLTIYLISEIPNITSTENLISSDGVGIYSGASGYRIDAGSLIIAPHSTSQLALCAVFNGASSAGYVSDFVTAAASGDVGTDGMSTITLGGVGASTATLNGYIWRVIGYSGAHDQATRKQIGDYLAARYMITITT